MKKEHRTITIDQLRVGDSSSITRAFSERDVQIFAAVTGDANPAHLDEEYARGTMFKTRIVHGMLVASLFSAILGTQMPGLGTIYTGQTLKFRRPVLLDEPITATLTVKEVLLEKNRVIFDCLAVNETGEAVIIGEATVLPPKAETTT
jgi:3-hydroxybutyryl-CoA dehydratase